MINLACQKPSIFPTIVPKGDRIPLLQYVDGTLLFIRASRQNNTKIKALLDAYGAKAGQNLNSSKSTLIFSAAMARQHGYGDPLS